ncbi:PhnD/SsuA/transferrin family substrate-binding protein [Geoalkalibacter halelectricus]|uniref:PhnD/SsuA/transferrin family substrate-binding protein n=1 Tax=Geoalkalibacter halelectricus TaxID=2847045 RepID=A0ABY5ZQE7_9BACT|nr:PhnD/SsuA/transferrin family substrate-binding protein [Geoalkalibacter halelectricus]MDO3378519.1 PhnD/SsuA/transferrin family substrate-binding protein [Geoalkalibacter halelectricus]UWZ80167.1 PhnD/SsuA/transferrin family substrate-binding protein [Geoalkalibacter halelectricus]
MNTRPSHCRFRKTSQIWCALAAILGLFLFAEPAVALRYSPIPMVNQEKVVADTRPFLDYLEAELGREIRLIYPRDNAQVVQDFVDDRLDLAEVGPLPYLLLRELAPHAQAVLFFLEQGAGATYTCALVAPFDGVASVEQLGAFNPLRLASTQRLSTCGPLTTSWLLAQGGINPRPVEFVHLGNHEKVALAIARAEFAAGGMKTLVARRYHHLGVRVLAQTPPLPVFALVVNTRTLPAAEVADLVAALLRATPEIRASWVVGGHGFAEVEPGAYKSLERVLLDLELSVQEFFAP